MTPENVCRLCLATDTTMRDITNSPLLCIYEKLMNISTDDRPVATCYFCLSQLKKCHALLKRARTSYKLLSQIHQNGMMVNRESIARINREAHKLDYCFGITQAEYIVIESRHNITKTEIKDEPSTQDMASNNDALPNVENDKLPNEKDIKREVSDEMEAIESDRLIHEKDIKTERSGQTNVQINELTCGSNIDQNDLKREVPDAAEEVASETLNRRDNDYEILKTIQEVPENIVENEDSTDDCELLDYAANNEYDALLDIDDMKLQHSDGAAAQQHKQTRDETREKILTTDYENYLNNAKCKTSTQEKEYAGKSNFSEHITRHNDSEVKKSYLDMNSVDSGPSTALNYNNDKTYSQTKFNCDDCGTEFDDICLLLKHIEFHKIAKVNVTTDKLRPHKCIFCEKTFIKKGFLTRHLKMHAVENKNATSEYISARFLRDKTNRQFVNTSRHSDIENKNFFDLKSNDEKIIDVENKYLQTKFICDHCGTEFNDKCLLIKHIKCHEIVKVNTTNDKERPHECNLCEKTFIKKGFLTRHLKIHAEKNETINRREFENTTRHSDIENKTFFDLKSNNDEKIIDVENKYLQTKFICDHCGTEFNDKCLLIKHIKCHEIIKVNITSDKVRINKYSPLKINLTSDKERPYGCTVCKKRFIKKGFMLRHLKTHTEELNKTRKKVQKREGGKIISKTFAKQTVNCPVCQQICHKNVLNTHLRTHTGEKPYECTTCQRKFGQLGHLNRHERIHSGEKPYECTICLRKFTQKYDMKLHLIRHTETVSHTDKFECPTCDRKFSHKKHLTFHMKRHALGNLFECSTCQRRYTKESYLKIHITSHTGEKPFECNICHAKFNRKDSLYTHVRNHSGEKPFECDVCHRKFSLKKLLIKHLRIHSGDTPYECDICYRRFNRKYSLNCHIKKLHTTHPREPFECTICHEKFNRKDTLYAHVNNHSVKKTLECDSCHRKLSSKVSLIRHFKLIHSGERPYECDICNRNFNLKSSLSLHIKKIHAI